MRGPPVLEIRHDEPMIASVESPQVAVFGTPIAAQVSAAFRLTVSIHSVHGTLGVRPFMREHNRHNEPITTDSSIERSAGGLGIGPALVKSLVELHDGSVEARSEGQRQGCESETRLPLAACTSKPAAVVAEVAPGKPVDLLRILIADDNTDSAESLSILLGLEGHSTRIATDGLEAVEIAEQLRPDVIVLDIGMPRLNGLDACRRIRRQSWSAGTLLIALSGWSQDADLKRSEEAGFDAHLVKPVDHDALRKLLADHRAV